jgi:hypothetical protein
MERAWQVIALTAIDFAPRSDAVACADAAGFHSPCHAMPEVRRTAATTPRHLSLTPSSRRSFAACRMPAEDADTRTPRMRDARERR